MSTQAGAGLVSDTPVRARTEPRLLTRQPVGFVIAMLGLAPSNSILNWAYQSFVWAFLLACPTLLFYLAFGVSSKFTESTLAGLAIISLASLVAHAASGAAVRRSDLDHEGNVLHMLDPNKQRTMNTLLFWYTTGAAVMSAGLSIFWNVNLYLALEPRSDWDKSTTKAVYFLQIVATSYSISAFMFAMAMYALTCNFLRLQSKGLIRGIRENRLNLRTIMRYHQTVKSSVRFTCTQCSHWLFPTLCIYAFSIAFQIVGYFHDRHERSQYNGAYYVGVQSFVIVFVLVCASTVNGQIFKIAGAVSYLYTRPEFPAKADIKFVLQYLRSSDDSFKILDIVISRALTNGTIFVFLSSFGAFLWESIH